MASEYDVRDLDGMTPSLGHPGQSDLASDFIDLLNAHDALLDRAADSRGIATVALGAAAVTIAVGLAYDGKPVVWDLLGTADATFTAKVSAVWDGAGNLTLTGNANATADATVSYAVLV